MRIHWYVHYLPVPGHDAVTRISRDQLAARLSEFADTVLFDDDGGLRVGFTDRQVIAEGIQAASAAVMAEQGYERQGRPQMVPVYSAEELARSRSYPRPAVAAPTGEESANLAASGDLGGGKSWLLRTFTDSRDDGGVR